MAGSRHSGIPTAVTVVAAAAFVTAGLDLMPGLRHVAVAVGSRWTADRAWTVLTSHGAEGAALRSGFVSAFAAAGLLLALVGFLRLRHWAWTALMAWTGLDLAVLLTKAASGSPPYPALALGATTALLLNLDSVRGAFRSAGTLAGEEASRSDQHA